MQINENWEYQQFDTLFDWCEKSKIKSGAGKQNGKYKMFVCSDTDVKYYDEYLQDSEALVFGTGGKASCHYVNGKFAYSTDCIVAVKSSNELLLKFYYYFLRQQNMKLIQETFTGSGLEHTSKKKIGQLLVPVPSLPEQQRIVAKIEELFAELDNSVAMLKKVKEQLEIYRLSVLQAVFGNKKYETVKICQFADVGTGATPLKSNANYYGGEIPWVNSSKVNDEYIDTASDFITELAIKETNCKIYPIGTLLMAMYGEGKTRGKCAELKIAAATNQAIAAIVLKKDACILKDFLKLYLLYNYQGIRRKSSGGVQPNINLNIVKNFIVPLYDKNVQKELVKKIKEVFAKCDCLENSVDTSLQQADALRQSILKKAFEGEL